MDIYEKLYKKYKKKYLNLKILKGGDDKYSTIDKHVPIFYTYLDKSLNPVPLLL